MDRTRTALREMARDDPELAARLVLQTLPAAAARIRGPLRYTLTVGELGTWLVDVDGMLGGRVRIRGKRRRAMRLRAMSSAGELSMADALASGGQLDPDAVYRSLAYLIDPDWTRGHRFTIAYELTGEGGGRWYVHVNDGERVRVTTEPPAEPVAGTTRVSVYTFRGLVAGQITPAQSMREQLADVEGDIFPTVVVGRWIERAQGRDDAEMQREARQRAIQARRAGSWGGSANGAAPAASGNGAGAQVS